MVALEKELAPEFSLISVPCVWLAQKFLELPNVRILPHGVDKEVFDACKTNPYGVAPAKPDTPSFAMNG